MNDLSKDFQELKQFVADLKADRAAQKAKEAKEAWTKHVSISLVLIAVLAAVATQRGGGFSSRSMKHMSEASLLQSQASDQWSYYEAKSIKLHIDEGELARTKAAGGADAKLEARISRYAQEEAAIKAKAEDLEHKRTEQREAAEKAGGMSRELGTVVTMFQVAVACGSISIVVKRKSLWFAALALALGGAVRLGWILFAA